MDSDLPQEEELLYCTRGSGMHDFYADLRTGVRSLLKRPGFLITAVVTLAIGIGANATVFAITDALLLRPLPFGARSSRVVTLHWTHPTLVPDWSSGTMSYAGIEDLPKATRAFEEIGGYIERSVTLTGGDAAERVRGGSVTTHLFEALAAKPIIGRSFIEADAAAPGFEQVVILSHGLWTRRFGADPNLVGRPIQINERTLTVAGVMPPGFRFPERDDLWLPYQPADEQRRADRNMFGVAVLSEGTSLEQAQRELDRIS
ncbi:MAG: ABC transporter permease, partial [Acidobacteria bacterium]|nr:ABC transporter permease [Acidobacteriota bacterium]